MLFDGLQIRGSLRINNKREKVLMTHLPFNGNI